MIHECDLLRISFHKDLNDSSFFVRADSTFRYKL